MSHLLEEGVFAGWDSWSLRRIEDYHEDLKKLADEKEAQEEELLRVRRFVPFLVRAFSYPLKSALLKKFDEMQDGMDQLSETVKKAKKKKRKKRS